MRNLVKVLLLYFTTTSTLQHPSIIEHLIFTKVQICIRSIVDFIQLTQYKSYTNETIQYLEWYLKAFHNHKDIFKEYQKNKSIAQKIHNITVRIQNENYDELNRYQ